MIRCRLIAPHLPDFVRERLDPKMRANVAAHLEICPRCSSEADAFRAARSFFDGAQAPSTRRSFDDLRPRLASVPGTAALSIGSTTRPLRIAAATMALAALAGVGFVTFRALVPSTGSDRIAVASPAATASPSIAVATPAPQATPATATANAAANVTPHERSAPENPPTVADRTPSRSPRRVSAPASPIVRRPRDRVSPLPALQTASDNVRPVVDDLVFLNPSLPGPDAGRREADLLASVAGGDNFVTITAPPIAGSGSAASTALASLRQEQAIIDTRLVRPMTLSVKGMTFAGLCERLKEETGIVFTANRRVADDEVTVFCTKRPLRELMRQMVLHFGFEWRRSGVEPNFEYELTQSLGRQLVEENLRQKDRDDMLVQIEEGVKSFSKLLALSPEQQEARAKDLAPDLAHDRAAFDEWSKLQWLRQGAQTTLPQFLRLSATELDQLRSGGTYSWDLMPGGVLPDSVRSQANAAFTDPSGKPLIPGPITSLTGTLRLERKEGELILRGGFSRNGTGIELPIAVAKSPELRKIDNAARNKALAKNPGYQQSITVSIAPTCTLKRHPYPEFDEFDAGPKIIAADALEAIHNATGRDVIGDQFLRIVSPPPVARGTTFAVLCELCDRLRLHWGEQGGWLTFRTPDYYTARVQQVPMSKRERWASSRRKNNRLSVDDLTEIGTLPAAALDSSDVAQSMLARYDLVEWPLARQPQARPHFALLAALTPEQRALAASADGLPYTDLRPKLRAQFQTLLDTADRPNPPILKNARLWVLTGDDASRFLPNPGVTFLYRYDDPNTYNAVSPFNGMFGLNEPMYQQRLKKP